MVHLLLAIALVGLVAGLLVKFVPMPAPLQQIIIIAASIFAVMMLLDGSGILKSAP